MSPTKKEATDKPKRGRRPKPESDKAEADLFMSIWDYEYEIFVEAAGRDSVSDFLRHAVFELIESGETQIESPPPVSRVDGVKYMLLMTKTEKESLVKVAAERFKLPSSGLVRAAGLRKAGKLKRSGTS